MVEKTKMNNLNDVGQILQFFDDGMSIKDISNKSKEKLGYKLKESTVFEILKRNNRITVENITKMYKIISKKEILSERERIILEIEEMPEKEEIPFSNTVPPHNVHYGYPL